MQEKEQIQTKKKLILKALADTMKELRGDKSQFLFACENDLSISIISSAERGLKDPQLTTLFKIAEGFGISPGKFLEKIWEKLPKDFEMIEK